MSIFNFFKKTTRFYKIAKTLQSGYLSMEDGHQIYFETSGNKNGIPVVILHGGPGESLSESKRAIYNPKKYYIIQFDQRGCGKSIPKYSIQDNTTEHLLKDIEVLRKYLNINKWVVAGGSWGSALGLYYALEYKDNVLGLLLNGLFDPTNIKSFDDLYEKTGVVAKLYPDIYESILDGLTKSEQKKVRLSLLNKINSENATEKEKYIKQWAKLESKVFKLSMNFASADDYVENYEGFIDKMNVFFHYFNNGCFMPENFFNRLVELKDKKVYICHGRFDMLCGVSSAYSMHKQIKNSKFFIFNDGHSFDTKQAKLQLVKNADDLIDYIQNK